LTCRPNLAAEEGENAMFKRTTTLLVALIVMLALSSATASGANIVWVNEDRGGGGGDAGRGMGALTWDDSLWRVLLEGAGHNIIANGAPYFVDIDLEPDRLALLNSADLVIVSRDANSGDYDDSPEEIEAWTSGVTVPMIVMTPYHMRNSRWRMVDTTGTPTSTETNLVVGEPNHPIFAGVPLGANNEVEFWVPLSDTDNINYTDALDVGPGQILAWEAGTEFPAIIFWEKGVEFYPGSDTFAGNTRLFFAGGSDDDPNTWGEKNITPAGDQMFLNAVNFMTGGPAAPRLQGGDADQDLDFDQLDLVKVQIAAKYLTGQAATWGEGDWNGAPGGQVGSPPAGNGLFDQLDIIAALAPGHYLKGPYAAISSGGRAGDGQTSVGYNPSTGEVFVDAPAGTNLTSINIDSAAGIFTGAPAQNLGGSFDNDSDTNIFKATFGSSFGSLTFGNVAQPGLSQQVVLGDLTVVGSLAGGGALGNVDLIYVPEPASAVLATLGVVLAMLLARRRRR
jgi:hypothetical protein